MLRIPCGEARSASREPELSAALAAAAAVHFRGPLVLTGPTRGGSIEADDELLTRAREALARFQLV